MKHRYYHAHITDRAVGEITEHAQDLCSRQVVEIDPFDLNVCACSVYDSTSYVCESLEIFENIAYINFSILVHFISENITSTNCLGL